MQDEEIAAFPATPPGRSKLTLKVSGQTVTHELKTGESREDFRTERLGKIPVAEAGATQIVLTASERPGVLAIHLRRVTFQLLEE